MSKKDKKRVGPAADQAEEQAQQGRQPQATIQGETLVYSGSLLPPCPPLVITEEDIWVAAAALDAGAAVHPGWAAAFQSGWEYAKMKEQEEAQRAGGPSEGSANGYVE